MPDDDVTVWCPFCMTLETGEAGECSCGGMRIELDDIEVDIVQLLKEKHVLSRGEIEDALGYSNIYRRLRDMATGGVIEKYKMDEGRYAGKLLYAPNIDVFIAWAHEELPFPQFYRVLRNLNRTSNIYQTVNVRMDVYNAVKAHADMEGTSVRRFAEDAILEKIEVS